MFDIGIDIERNIFIVDDTSTARKLQNVATWDFTGGVILRYFNFNALQHVLEWYPRTHSKKVTAYRT